MTSSPNSETQSKTNILEMNKKNRIFQFFQEYVQCIFNQAHYDDDCLDVGHLGFLGSK